MESTVRILPEILTNRIAAGEVVERPASVVKELVENALDAGSSQICIEIENGGRRSIRVSDNGSGMGQDDALLALERYATSKIHTDTDLFKIKTLGFRGEALPSIAAVACLTLETRNPSSPSGTKIYIKGGKIKDVTVVGIPVGTRVTVQNLFFNTPARRKFLKSTNTETGHILDIISRMGMAFPGVHFKLHSNGHKVHNWTRVSDLGVRISDVLNLNLTKDFTGINFQSEEVAISGWVSLTRLTRNTARGISFFVNDRLVRDRTLLHALMAGYSGKLMKGRYPLAIIYLQVSTEEVDVNVHPAKNEVRFVQQAKIHTAMEKGTRAALRTIDQPSRETPIQNQEQTGLVSEKINLFESKPQQTELWEKKHFTDLIVIGIIRGLYIICQSHQGLIIVDQHAAHERILYEQLRKNKTKGTSQRLLMPEQLDLNLREAEILTSLLPEFAKTGLEIESFGGSTFVITAVPVILGAGENAPMVKDIIAKMTEMGFADQNAVPKVLDKTFKLMACHGAVRGGQDLSELEIKALFKQLDHCVDPGHCPHGRPTCVEWPFSLIEKAFGRRP